MSKFTDLRSARERKETKSFIHAQPNLNSSPVQETRQQDTTHWESALPIAPLPKLSVLAERPAGLPDSVDIRETAETGRGVYAKQSFSPGSIIASHRPRVAVLSTSRLQSYCSHCCRSTPGKPLQRCTGCRTVYYCSAGCQKLDWPSHKAECAALTRWAASAPSADVAIPSDAIRCLGRVLFSLQKKGVDSAWAREWNQLQSHRASMPPSAFESHTHLAHSVVRYIGASSPAELAPYGLSSAGDLVDLISRFTTNTFTLTSFVLDPIGVCVSPVFALVNHSCEPNAALVFPQSSENLAQEPQMQLTAIRPIAPGEEILGSYVDITVPRETRRAMLKETYNFLCECALCNRERHSSPRQSMWCPKACGGICPLPTEENDRPQCTECNTLVPSLDLVLDALRLGQEALDKALGLQFTDPAHARRLTSKMIPLLTSAGLTPSCHPLLAITRLHQELLVASFSADMSQELLDETIQAAAKYVAGVTAVLVYGHPVRGAGLAELGKLLAVDEISPSNPSAQNINRYPPSGPARLRLAYETLLKAHGELSIGFGKLTGGGRMGKDVHENLVRLEKELGVWTQGIRDTLEDQKLASKAS